MKQVTVEGKMMMHLAMDTVHLMKYQYTIKGEGLLNDRVFYGECTTPKRKNSIGKFGKPKWIFYYDMNDKIYPDISTLLVSKNLTLKGELK
jgi:hypothetical protein